MNLKSFEIRIAQVLLVLTLLLLSRVFLTQKLTFIFLFWNLFLAFIPYLIAKYIRKNQNLQTIKFCGLVILWLLFFPNAPYIISDLVHLQGSFRSPLFWLDLTIILSFSLLGLFTGVISLQIITQNIMVRSSRKRAIFLQFIFIILAGLGIYLGRVLRWNSWDIITNPLGLLIDFMDIILYPSKNKIAYTMIFSFALIIYITNELINIIIKFKDES